MFKGGVHKDDSVSVAIPTFGAVLNGGEIQGSWIDEREVWDWIERRKPFSALLGLPPAEEQRWEVVPIPMTTVEVASPDLPTLDQEPADSDAPPPPAAPSDPLLAVEDTSTPEEPAPDTLEPPPRRSPPRRSRGSA